MSISESLPSRLSSFRFSPVKISFFSRYLFPPPTDPELERLKRENGSHKDVEKCEGRFKKAKEEYKMFVEKYAIVREDFNRKMGESSLRFQGQNSLFCLDEELAHNCSVYMGKWCKV